MIFHGSTYVFDGLLPYLTEIPGFDIIRLSTNLKGEIKMKIEKTEDAKHTSISNDCMPKYRARCIQWDKTDDDGTSVNIDLPSEVVVSLEDLKLPSDAAESEIEDVLSEYLVDRYGFCHYGFFFEKMDMT